MDSAGALSCHVRDCAGGCCSAAGTFCYRPGSGFSGGRADRPAPAAAAFGASGLGAAPPAPATYTPESRKDQVEPKQPIKTDVGEVILTTQQLGWLRLDPDSGVTGGSLLMEFKVMISFGRNLACGLDMTQGLYD